MKLYIITTKFPVPVDNSFFQKREVGENLFLYHFHNYFSRNTLETIDSLLYEKIIKNSWNQEVDDFYDSQIRGPVNLDFANKMFPVLEHEKGNLISLFSNESYRHFFHFRNDDTCYVIYRCLEGTTSSSVRSDFLSAIIMDALKLAGAAEDEYTEVYLCVHDGDLGIEKEEVFDEQATIIGSANGSLDYMDKSSEKVKVNLLITFKHNSHIAELINKIKHVNRESPGAIAELNFLYNNLWQRKKVSKTELWESVLKKLE